MPLVAPVTIAVRPAKSFSSVNSVHLAMSQTGISEDAHYSKGHEVSTIRVSGWDSEERQDIGWTHLLTQNGTDSLTAGSLSLDASFIVKRCREFKIVGALGG